MRLVPDPDCPDCHGTGIIGGKVHEVIPDRPGAAWWKDNDRWCECTNMWDVLPVVSAGTLQRFFADLERFLLTGEA